MSRSDFSGPAHPPILHFIGGELVWSELITLSDESVILSALALLRVYMAIFYLRCWCEVIFIGVFIHFVSRILGRRNCNELFIYYAVWRVLL